MSERHESRDRAAWKVRPKINPNALARTPRAGERVGGRMIWFNEGRFWDGIGCKAILFKTYINDRNGKHVATEISGIFITDLFIV